MVTCGLLGRGECCGGTHTVLQVRGLPPQVDKASVTTHFGLYGRVRQVRLRTGRALVTFREGRSAAAAARGPAYFGDCPLVFCLVPFRCETDFFFGAPPARQGRKLLKPASRQ
eukprot:TRINITY_DN19698_c0_g1_i1.p2 TRINITY_DN19698_c0_g1~~TRINITY_DN19698_c0_g1_i1.p2  ORF type:complete len:113 (-),score=25.60 TRINITY_DN19698_c0_g1_i1:185-523(-)